MTLFNTPQFFCGFYDLVQVNQLLGQNLGDWD